MNSRERVMTALNHEKPDRCPMQVSITPEYAVVLGDDLLSALIDQDVLLASVGWSTSYYRDLDTYTDEWGVGWKKVWYDTRFGRGFYTEIVGHPLADDAAIDSFKAPDPERPGLYDETKKMIAEYGSSHYICGDVVCTIFETAWALRGLEQTLMDFVMNPDLLERIFDIPCRYHLSAAKKLVELGVDMIWLGDDVGTQHSMMMRPETWRRFLKPRLAKIISELKAINPDLKIAYHSDGVIYPIIPDLIEIGLDVLNPVQPACMDPVKLKKEYGDRLCFWGTIDEQYTLPFGTPQEVREEVLARIRTVGRNGGLIIGPTHNVQLDTPLENYHAMVNTIRETEYSSL
jgi:uroporphyrinogen decarboxylase